MLRSCLLAACCAFAAGAALAQDAGALRERYAELQQQLAASAFGRPLHVQSRASGGAHNGEVYAVVEHPYDVVAPALARPSHWCDILMLQVNVKRCDAPGAGAGPTVTAFITRKPRGAVEDAHRVEFRYALAAAGADYVRIALTAPSGPVGTSDFQIRVEAAPADSARTLLHMSYAYTLGFMARIAMDAYLATSGRHKAGFSVVDRLPDSRPVHVDGVRGVVERSAMRYYLAVEAFLDSLSAPAGERLETRLRDWYAAIERYPLQLRESIGAQEYLEMKRREASRPAG
jgi:hypothetical protein